MADPISGLRILPSEVDAASHRAGPREWGFTETLRGAMDQVSDLQSAAGECAWIENLHGRGQ